ncbi:MAG: NADP-dependent oxidoreductase [Proteobacteria bacterium]|nr:NADP-dependent oxidoreductase [Pseudomonadota bacterium]
MSGLDAQAVNRQIILERKPKDKLSPDHFRILESPIPEPGPGEVLTRTLYLSIDPAARSWMQGRTYTDPVRPGMVMPGYSLARVVVSRDPGLSPGDLVEGAGGWRDYAVAPAGEWYKRPWREPLTHYLSVLGVTGKTAYFGLLDIGRPRSGETVVISAAAGAVGSVAGQIARIKGARVVGLAGSDEKCALLTETFGFDAAVNYKTNNLLKALARQCPDGIDVYFDNVGGGVFEAALFLMNTRGRIVCCGAVSSYDGAPPESGPRGIPGLIVVKRLRLEGFIVFDHYDRRDQADSDLSAWVDQGMIQVREDVIDGLENAPRALVGLLAGENVGKRMIRVS